MMEEMATRSTQHIVDLIENFDRCAVGTSAQHASHFEFFCSRSKCKANRNMNSSNACLILQNRAEQRKPLLVLLGILERAEGTHTDIHICLDHFGNKEEAMV